MEVWKNVIGYEGLYEVSDLGRVRGGRGVLKPQIIGGYQRVHLHKEQKFKHHLVHRLVAEAFLPNPDGLPQVNHKDEDKTNNCVDNLEWCTAKYNCNYGNRTQKQIATKIEKGIYDPEMCGYDRKTYDMIRYKIKKK